MSTHSEAVLQAATTDLALDTVSYLPEHRSQSAGHGISARQVVMAGAAFLFVVVAVMSRMHMRSLDFGLVRGLNVYSQHSIAFDHAMLALMRDMFSNAILVTLVCAAWFNTKNREQRAGVFLGVIVSFLSGVVSRSIQVFTPMHARPLHDPSLHFRLPAGMHPEALNHWSSFPSDHAAVYFGLVTMLFLANRKLGWIGLGTAILLNVVRIYLGYHFPTDILGGAMLGIFCVLAAQRLRTSRIVRAAMAFEANCPGLFYACAFYFCFGLSTLFYEQREVASQLVHFLRHS